MSALGKKTALGHRRRGKESSPSNDTRTDAKQSKREPDREREPHVKMERYR